MNKPNISTVDFSLIDQTDCEVIGNNVFDSTDNEFIGKKEDCIVVTWWGRHCEDCDPEQFFRVILKEDLNTFNPND